MLEPLTDLVPLGGPPDDPLARPEIDLEGSPLLEQEEVMMHSGHYPVGITAFQRKQNKFTTVLKASKNAQVILTTRRVIVTWPHWKSDKAFGGVIERRVYSAVLERDKGKLLLAAHIRHAWILSVSVGNPQGLLIKTNYVSIRIREGRETYSLVIKKIDPSITEQLVQEFVAELATVRLEQKKTFEGSEKEDLSALAEDTATPDRFDWGYSYKIPGNVPFGQSFLSASA
ncbi:MAG: hypothetical protein WB507_06105 [Solirubrobacterales bacterium]